MAVLLGVLLLTPGPAEACSVCLAGDPLFSEHGGSAQAEGAWSVYFQAQGWRKESGLLPHEDEAEEEEEEEGHEEGTERNRSQRLDLFVSWTPIDRLTLTLEVPFAFNEIKEIEDGTSKTFRLDGLGDVSLTGTVVLWRDRPVLPSTWLEGRVFLKTPTGRHGRRDRGIVDPHLQPGTGSWDYGFGLAGVHRQSWGTLYASVFYRENSEADIDGLDYAYGDVILANTALEVPIGHAFGCEALDWLTLAGELNFRWAASDRVEGDWFQDSGGSVLYATPSARVRLPFSVRGQPVSLRAAIQLPVTSSWLNGNQEEEEVWTVGLLFRF